MSLFISQTYAEVVQGIGTANLHNDIKVKNGCRDHGTATYQTH